MHLLNKDEINNAFDKLKEFKGNLQHLPIFNSKKAIVLTLITLLLLVYVFYKIHFIDFVNALTYLNLKTFGILFLLSLFEIYLYSKRFVDVIEVRYNLQAFFHYLVGFAFGRLVPPRIFGEYLRLLLTQRYFNVGISKAIFAIIIDNLYDGIVLAVFSIFAAFVLSGKLAIWKIIILLLLILGGLYTFYILYVNFKFLNNVFGVNLFKKLFLYAIYKLKEIWHEFLKLNKATLIYGLFLTTINFLISFLKAFIILKLLGYDIGFITVAAIWTLAHLAGNASMLPGGLGAFEITFSFLLVGYGVPESIGLVAALIERFFNIWMFGIVGLGYFIYVRPSIHKVQLNIVSFLLSNSESFIKKSGKAINKGAKKLKGIREKMKDGIKKQ